MGRRWFLLLPVMAAALWLVWGTPLQAAVLERVSIHSVQADFLQEKQLPMLAVPLHSQGRFFFQAPTDLRWEYTTPFRSVLLMRAGRVRKFAEQDGQMVEEPSMGMDGIQVVLTEIGNWLDGRFTENNVFQVSRPGQDTVVLTPKQAGVRALISSIELTLADQAGLLKTITIREGDQGFTRLTFTGAVLNREINPDLFIRP